MKPKTDSSVIRYVLATLLIGLSLYFAYAVISVQTHSGSSGGSSSLVRANGSSTATARSHRTCNAPKSGTKIVQIYPKDPALSLTLYTFPHDELSTQVHAHANGKGPMVGSGLHTFYATQLCTSPAPAAPLPGSSSNSSNSSNSSTSPAAPEPDALAPPRHCSGVVLDVGAFIGTQALVLAKMGFHVHAFEPQAAAAELLRCSSLANKLSTLRVIEEGVSDVMGKECLLFPMAQLTHQAMLAPKSLSNITCHPTALVPVVTLDHYWRDVLDKQQILMITMDAEGDEENILSGGEQLFKEAPPPFMILDYDPKALSFKSSTPKTLLTKVGKAGYVTYDCQADAYLTQGRDGEAVLESYKARGMHASLLLVHAKHLNGTKPKYICDE